MLIADLECLRANRDQHLFWLRRFTEKLLSHLNRFIGAAVLTGLVSLSALPCSAQESEPVSGNMSVVDSSKASLDVISPDVLRQINKLWDLKAVRKGSFAVETLSSVVEDGYRTDELYFTSRTIAAGPDRVFVTFSRPVNPEPKVPAYIDLTGGRELAGVKWLARQYRGAVLDIEWRSPTLPYHTKWAKPSPQALFGLNPDLNEDFNTMFAIAIMRAIDYLQTQPGIDPKRIACGGGSMGGWYSMLTAGLDRRVSCVYDAYGAGWNVATALDPLPVEKQRIWRRAFDPMTYAGKTAASTLMYIGTNDYFFPPDHATTHFAKLSGEKRVLFLPNVNHNFAAFGQQLPSVDKAWIDYCFHGGPAFPIASTPVGKGSVYRWKVRGPVTIASSTLYWSPGRTVWPGRYWLSAPGVEHNGAWSAEIPERYSSLCGAVFVNAFDKDGRGVSSQIVTRAGMDPQKTVGPQWPGSALWDIERGAMAWRRPGPAHDYALWSEDLEFAATTGFKVTPTDPANKFAVITNSVILASATASGHSGILLTLDGLGRPGELLVTLERNSGNQYRIAYSAKVSYPAGAVTIRIPWADFKARDSATGGPYPFDALRIEGDREKGTALKFSQVELW